MPAPNYRFIAFIVAVAFFMQGLDGSIINTSMPQMAHSFGIAPVHLSVGITTYMLSVATFIPLSGWIADRWGARNVFSVAIVVFVAASLVCGLSNNLWSLAIARAVQGLGGALMTPVGRLVVLRNTEKSQLLNATAMISWPGLTAPVLGPALGGFITDTFGWRWNFLMNIPLGVVGLILVLLFIPNFKDETRRPLDIKGFLLTAAALVCLLYGLESLAHGGHGRLLAGVLVLAGLASGYASIRHLRQAAHPLLNLEPLKVQTFAAAALGAGTFFRMSINATPFLLPLLFQVGFGMSAAQSGLYVLVYFAGNLGMKTVTSPILRRFGFRTVLTVNGLIGGAAILACAFFTPTTPREVIFAVLLIAGLTRSMQFTSLNTIAFADVESPQRGSATTLSSMLQQVSMVMGVAVAALLLNSSQALRGAATTGLLDFRIAFVLVGLMGIGAALAFLRLDPHAGAEVSGRAVPAANPRAAAV